MHGLGISSGADLRKCSRAFLSEQFGKAGDHFYQIARAIDNRKVNPVRTRKSLSAETTYEHDLYGYEAISAALQPIAQEVAARCARSEYWGRTITLKLRFADFKTITRSVSYQQPLREAEQISRQIPLLLDKVRLGRQGVRLLGLGLSNAESSTPAAQPLSLPIGEV